MNSTFTLLSPQTKTEYVIYVAAPARTRGNQPLPAIVFLDGDNQFSTAVAAYRKLRRHRRVPRLLLVGVGYGAGYGKPANKRGRDYTPTAHTDEPESGGASAFLKFLRSTLWRELEQRYSLRQDVRGIGGHSLGSLAALSALFGQRAFFTHYLASAPSIWWDNRSILKIAAKRRSRNVRLRAKLFLGLGEKDSASMQADLSAFERQLAAKPFRGLELTSQRFPKRDHYNVLPDAFAAGLVNLFSRLSSPKSRR